VLRPFAHLVLELGRPDASVLSGPSAARLLDRALDIEGHNDTAYWFATRLTLIRKALALDESLEPFDERDVTVARATAARRPGVSRAALLRSSLDPLRFPVPIRYLLR
jgi:hypothetical protein